MITSVDVGVVRHSRVAGAGSGAPHHRVSQLLGLVAMVLMAACERAGGASGPTEFPVAIVVSNSLIAPVTISVDAVPSLGLQGGRSGGLTVSSMAKWVTWTSAKPMDARGQPIPDDIGEVRIAVSGITGLLEISNVIGDQTYVTAQIFNQVKAPVSIGVSNGISVSCAAELPAASGTVSGFTRIGYYKVLPATEVRAYRGPACSGPYLSWPSSELKGFMAKSGLVSLSLTSAP
ncbi:MAG: hypothetical protein AABZ80_06020 [Gemmatimonadota bacterium]|mgnify:CR=1 FL=1